MRTQTTTRRLRPDLLLFSGLCLLFLALLVALVVKVAPRLDDALRDYDSRSLINGYELWMLKGHPREITLGNTTGSTTTPSNWTAATHEIGRYAIAGDLMVGEIVSRGAASLPPPGRFFILDTKAHRLRELGSEAEWRSAIKEAAIDFHALEWRY